MFPQFPSPKFSSPSNFFNMLPFVITGVLSGFGGGTKEFKDWWETSCFLKGKSGTFSMLKFPENMVCGCLIKSFYSSDFCLILVGVVSKSKMGERFTLGETKYESSTMMFPGVFDLMLMYFPSLK